MSVPSTFQALYTSLDNYLTTFNETVASWTGAKPPVTFSANLVNADADNGPQLVNAGSLAGILVQLQALKAMGVGAITIEVSFPMLYEPFLGSSLYGQFVEFYQSLANSVRAAGLKLIVENEVLLNDSTVDSWDMPPFYASLNWAEYQAARAQTAVTIAQTMAPDYMVLLEEPDTEASMSGQTEVNTPTGAAALLSGMLTALKAANVKGTLFGAGVGTWLSNYAQFIQGFLALPIDFVDMHVLVVNHSFLPNGIAIANMAAAAGKPCTITQSWLHKEADSELGIISNNVVLARNPFSFWSPLDTFFIQVMQNFAYYSKLAYIDIFETEYFFAYLAYGPATENLSPSAILAQESQQADANMLAGSFTSTAMSYYKSILPTPDTAAPSQPTGLTGGSDQTNLVYLSWSPSTDNVGVASYSVFRNGVMLGTTAQTYYEDTTVSPGVAYSYCIGASDLAGNRSKLSASVVVVAWDTAPPSPPTNLVASVISREQISLSWQAGPSGMPLIGYYVYQGTSSNNMARVATTNSTSYNAYYLKQNTTYYFAVEEFDEAGAVSPMSSWCSAKTS